MFCHDCMALEASDGDPVRDIQVHSWRGYLQLSIMVQASDITQAHKHLWGTLAVNMLSHSHTAVPQAYT